MSRLFRRFAKHVGRPSPGLPMSAASWSSAFSDFVSIGAVSPADLAAGSTFLWRRSREAQAMLVGIGHEANEETIQQLSQSLRREALSRLHTFSAVEMTELLHACSRTPTDDFRRKLVASSEVVRGRISSLEPRGLALVLNAYARVQVKDQAVFSAVSVRGTETSEGADPQAVTGLLFAFAKLRVYHHRLFSILKKRVTQLADELPLVEVARCLFAFSRSLPLPHKKEPLAFAYQLGHRGFGDVLSVLFARLEDLVRSASEKEPISTDTCLLSLQALEVLQWRSPSMLKVLFRQLDERLLSAQDHVVVLQAASRLCAGSFLRAPASLTVPFAGCSEAQRCMLVSNLTLLQFSTQPCVASRSRFPMHWTDFDLRTWVQRVCEAATSACSGGGASPAVALSCLVNLPPFSERLESATLRDLSRILAFARTTSSRKQDLITSAIQTEVDMSLRRISIVDGTPLQLDSESGVFPFWVDLVLTDFTPCLESFSAGRLA